MKTLNITFTEADFRRMKKARNKTTYKSWELFILTKCCKGVSEKRTYKHEIKNIV